MGNTREDETGMKPEEGHEADQAASDDVPWTVRDAWLGVGFLVVWWVVIFAVPLITRFTADNVDLGLFVGVAELVFLVPVWWFTVRKYRVGWGALGLQGFRAPMVGLGCGLLLASFAFNFVYSSVLALFGLRMQIDLMPILAQLSSPCLFLLAGVIVAPLVEELFFRGFVFSGLRTRYGWSRAAVISSALFALFHLQPLAIPPMFLLGYLFAFIYQRSRSLWPAILMHVLMNALALGAAYLALRMGIPSGTDPTDFFSPLPTSPIGGSPLPNVPP
jgi:membrane protease YdiL (CAAX protease family)